MRNGDISTFLIQRLVKRPSAADQRSRRLCRAHKVPGLCDSLRGKQKRGLTVAECSSDRDAKRLRVSQDRVYAVTEIWRRRRRDGTLRG